MKRFSQKEFSAEISFTNKDASQTATINGFISKHNLSINPETGDPINAKNVHISVVESVLIDAGYTTRNASGEIDLFEHKVEFIDASGQSFAFLIDDVMPSETFGLIVCTLGQFNNG